MKEIGWYFQTKMLTEFRVILSSLDEIIQSLCFNLKRSILMGKYKRQSMIINLQFLNGQETLQKKFTQNWQRIRSRIMNFSFSRAERSIIKEHFSKNKSSNMIFRNVLFILTLYLSTPPLKTNPNQLH